MAENDARSVAYELAAGAHVISGLRPGTTRLMSLLGAARLHNILPLVLLVGIAALARGEVVPLALAAASAFVFLTVLIGMHLNAITDRALDRVRKPHLAPSTLSDSRMLRVVLTVEMAACVVALTITWVAAPSRAIIVWMALLAILSITYSFNIFVPSRGAELRGKVHWLSHALTIQGSYLCLWMIGFTCAAGELRAGAEVLGLAVALSVVDYGVFIQESANDWAEERAAGLRTLPALWGQPRTSAAGLALVAGGVLFAWQQIDGLSNATAAPAIACLLGLQVVGTLASAGRARWPASVRGPDRRSTEGLMDVVFWGSRVAPFLLLLAAIA
jgi:4-hydroxybenzoate polyprenyltransferase